MQDPEAPTLATPRMVLRPWASSDLEAFQNMMSDVDVISGLTGDSRLVTATDAWWMFSGYVGHWVLRGHGTLVIADSSSGAFRGRLGTWQPPEAVEPEYTIALVTNIWGRGLFAELTAVFYDWLAQATRIDRLVVRVASSNTRSIAAFRHFERSTGLVPEATRLEQSGPSSFIVFHHHLDQWRSARG